MPLPQHSAAYILALGLPLLSRLGPAPALARDCRPWDLPPGVRMPDRPGCPPARRGEARPKPGREPGFVDLGNGTEIRINGRVRAEGRFDR